MRIYCTNCGSQLHTFEACPKTWNGSATRLHLRCAYCGSSKHNYEACPKIRSHPAEGGIIIRD